MVKFCFCVKMFIHLFCDKINIYFNQRLFRENYGRNSRHPAHCLVNNGKETDGQVIHLIFNVKRFIVYQE